MRNKNKYKIMFPIIASIFALLSNPSDINAAIHTHNQNCYPVGAELHIHSDACYQDLSKHDCGGTIEWEEIGSNTAKCPKCGNEIKIIYYSGTSTGCGQKFSSTYHERCSSCNYKITQVDSNEKVPYPQTACKYNVKNAGRGDLICGKENNTYYDQNGNKVELECSKVVTAIEPINSMQHTDTPDFTLQALYLDGHVANIQPTETNYDSSQTYNNAMITLKYTGQVEKIGNTGTLTTIVYVTSASENFDPYMSETGTSSSTITELTPITITPYPEVTLTPPSSGNKNNNNGTLGNTGYTSTSINSALGTTGNRTSGSNYYGNGYRGYQNSSIKNGNNATVKDNDTPAIGTSEAPKDDKLIVVPEDTYVKRTPVDIVFKTQKDVTPSTLYGTLKFSENVRNEKNDTVGTKKNDDNKKNNTTTPIPTTNPTQKQKKASMLPLVFVALVFIASIGAILFLLIKKKKEDVSDIEPQQMDLNDRLNL